jgi:hypothetical protein
VTWCSAGFSATGGSKWLNKWISVRAQQPEKSAAKTATAYVATIESSTERAIVVLRKMASGVPRDYTRIVTHMRDACGKSFASLRKSPMKLEPIRPVR